MDPNSKEISNQELGKIFSHFMRESCLGMCEGAVIGYILGLCLKKPRVFAMIGSSFQLGRTVNHYSEYYEREKYLTSNTPLSSRIPQQRLITENIYMDMHNKWKKYKIVEDINGEYICENPSIRPEVIEEFSKRDWGDKKRAVGRSKFAEIRAKYVINQIEEYYGMSIKELWDTNTYRDKHTISMCEIGCGGGHVCKELAASGCHIVGVDPAPGAIQQAREAASQGGQVEGSVIYQCRTLEDIVREGEKFDVVLCTEVLEHVQGPKFFAKNIVKILNVCIYIYIYIILG